MGQRIRHPYLPRSGALFPITTHLTRHHHEYSGLGTISGFPTESAADHKAQEIDVDRRRGTFQDPESGKITLAECVTRFAAADCCFTPILTLGEALESEHCHGRGLVRRGNEGDLQALFPARIDGEPPATRAPAREISDGFDDEGSRADD